MPAAKKTTKPQSVKKEKGGLPDRFTSDPRGIRFVDNKKSTVKKGK